MSAQDQWKLAWQMWRKNDWLNVPKRFFEAAKYADAGRPKYFCPNYEPFLAAIQRGHKAGISHDALHRYARDRAGNFAAAMIERHCQ